MFVRPPLLLHNATGHVRRDGVDFSKIDWEENLTEEEKCLPALFLLCLPSDDSRSKTRISPLGALSQRGGQIPK